VWEEEEEGMKQDSVLTGFELRIFGPSPGGRRPVIISED
jgi:hypothetical protein